MHLADLHSYAEARHRLRHLYRNADAWDRDAILNVAGSGKFRATAPFRKYANEISHSLRANRKLEVGAGRSRGFGSQVLAKPQAFSAVFLTSNNSEPSPL